MYMNVEAIPNTGFDLPPKIVPLVCHTSLMQAWYDDITLRATIDSTLNGAGLELSALDVATHWANVRGILVMMLADVGAGVILLSSGEGDELKPFSPESVFNYIHIEGRSWGVLTEQDRQKLKSLL